MRDKRYLVEDIQSRYISHTRIASESYPAKYPPRPIRRRRMGGLAFADERPPLHTPRMPPEVYTDTRDDLLGTLRKFYAQATCPIEGPGKTDHGDIDILVAEPLNDFDSDQIAAAIGAVKHKKTGGSQTTHFAVPWPTLPHPFSVGSIANDTSAVASWEHDQTYIQLDLHICTSASFTWEVFHQTHGDFWNIIGSTIRRLGLTPSNSGFYVRIEEIEARNKNAARILLTTSPSETLTFLGLDETRYWQKFETVDELFAYAATCRFFDPRKYDPARTKGDLKANDRARAKKRAVFRKWVEEYLPAQFDDAPADAAAVTMSKEEVVEEAKRWFGVTKKFEERRIEGLKGLKREKMWTQVRKELGIEGERVGAVMRGVKREVIGEENQLEEEMTTLQRAYAEDNCEMVLQWVRENWKEIEEWQRAYEKDKSTKNLLDKLGRLRAQGKADNNTRLGKAKEELTEAEDHRETGQVVNESSYTIEL